MQVVGSPVSTPVNAPSTQWRSQRCPLAPIVRRRDSGPVAGYADAAFFPSPSASPTSSAYPPMPSPVNRWPSWQSSPMSAQSPALGPSFFPVEAQVPAAGASFYPMEASYMQSPVTSPTHGFSLPESVQGPGRLGAVLVPSAGAQPSQLWFPAAAQPSQPLFLPVAAQPSQPCFPAPAQTSRPAALVASGSMEVDMTLTPSPIRRQFPMSDPMSSSPQTPPEKANCNRHTPGKLSFGHS